MSTSSLGFDGHAQRGTAIAKGNGGKNNTTDTLTTQEIEDLVHLREEEKLARDVYRYLYDVWGQWIFDNIASSEQQHMDAVKKLLDRYGIEVDTILSSDKETGAR